MAVVTNQKNLQISFALDDGNGRVSYMTLPIKPEELTRTEPNRVTTQQTLDGVFVDEFGRGLTTITISGNTGWGQGTRPAGDIMFLKLRDEFIHEWGRARRSLIDAGRDPNQVRLIFIDALNGPYVADVVPTQFTLRRSKSQPLLFLYTLAMTVIAEDAVNPFPELLEPVEDEAKVSASVESLDKSTTELIGTTPPAAGAEPGGLIGKLDGMADHIGTLGQSALAATKQTFAPAMALANQIIATAAAAKRALTAAEQATVNIAKELSATATTMWDAVASVASLPAAALSTIMQIKGAFSNVGCVLSNGFTDAMGKAVAPSYPYGSSNCSSTSYGGSAPSTTSTFVQPSGTPGITTTPSAAEAITSILHIDYTMPVNTDLLKSQIDLINAGTSVTPPTGTTPPADPADPAETSYIGTSLIDLAAAYAAAIAGGGLSGPIYSVLVGNSPGMLLESVSVDYISGKTGINITGSIRSMVSVDQYKQGSDGPEYDRSWSALELPAYCRLWWTSWGSIYNRLFTANSGSGENIVLGTDIVLTFDKTNAYNISADVQNPYITDSFKSTAYKLRLYVGLLPVSELYIQDEKLLGGTTQMPQWFAENELTFLQFDVDITGASFSKVYEDAEYWIASMPNKVLWNVYLNQDHVSNYAVVQLGLAHTIPFAISGIYMSDIKLMSGGIKMYEPYGVGRP